MSWICAWLLSKYTILASVIFCSKTTSWTKWNYKKAKYEIAFIFTGLGFQMNDIFWGKGRQKVHFSLPVSLSFSNFLYLLVFKGCKYIMMLFNYGFQGFFSPQTLTSARRNKMCLCEFMMWCDMGYQLTYFTSQSHKK